jgi:flavodoxin
MKVLITYHSKTGNTKKIAEAIHRYHSDWTLAPLNSADPEGFDLLFVGGWIHNSAFNPETSAFAEKLRNKDVAFFFTAGAYPTTKYAFDCTGNIIALLETNGNRVINHFHAQGALSPEMKSWMTGLSDKNPHGLDKYREIRWKHADNHPNGEDLDAAEFFAHQTVQMFTGTGIYAIRKQGDRT